MAIAREGSCVADLRLRISELKPEYARAKLFYKVWAGVDSSQPAVTVGHEGLGPISANTPKPFALHLTPCIIFAGEGTAGQ